MPSFHIEPRYVGIQVPFLIWDLINVKEDYVALDGKVIARFKTVLGKDGFNVHFILEE